MSDLLHFLSAVLLHKPLRAQLLREFEARHSHGFGVTALYEKGLHRARRSNSLGGSIHRRSTNKIQSSSSIKPSWRNYPRRTNYTYRRTDHWYNHPGPAKINQHQPTTTTARNLSALQLPLDIRRAAAATNIVTCRKVSLAPTLRIEKENESRARHYRERKRTSKTRSRFRRCLSLDCWAGRVTTRKRAIRAGARRKETGTRPLPVEPALQVCNQKRVRRCCYRESPVFRYRGFGYLLLHPLLQTFLGVCCCGPSVNEPNHLYMRVSISTSIAACLPLHRTVFP